MWIGLISDTHGLLRPEAVQALQGVERIIHGGDIGGPELLAALEAVAPVEAVRGNNDRGAWADKLPLHLTLQIEGVGIHVLHDVKELALDPAAGSCQVIVSGHSHKPGIVNRDGVLYVNPGSAGPRRFSLPVALGYLWVQDGTARAKIQHVL
jgi:putative phosphoesterase